MLGKKTKFKCTVTKHVQSEQSLCGSVAEVSFAEPACNMGGMGGSRCQQGVAPGRGEEIDDDLREKSSGRTLGGRCKSQALKAGCSRKSPPSRERTERRAVFER